MKIDRVKRSLIARVDAINKLVEEIEVLKKQVVNEESK